MPRQKYEMHIYILDESGIKISFRDGEIRIESDKLEDFCNRKYSTTGGVFKFDGKEIPVTAKEVKALDQYCRDFVRNAYTDRVTGKFREYPQYKLPKYSQGFES